MTDRFVSGNYLNGQVVKGKMRAGEFAGHSHRLKAAVSKRRV